MPKVCQIFVAYLQLPKDTPLAAQRLNIAHNVIYLRDWSWDPADWQDSSWNPAFMPRPFGHLADYPLTFNLLQCAAGKNSVQPSLPLPRLYR